MAEVIGGPRSWALRVDKDGYREYTVKYLVKADSATEGPRAAYQAQGLPPVGWPWWHVDQNGVDRDTFDRWATRRPETLVTIHQEKEGDCATWYAVECVFSNRPPDTNKCDGEETGNPLCIPDRVSGRFVKYVEEATTAETVDYYTGDSIVRALPADSEDLGTVPILTSSHERISGPQVEFDRNRQRVVVVQNVSNLNLELIGEMIDTLNDASLWGFSARTIKLSDVSWVKRYYGVSENVGYTGTGTNSLEDCIGTDNCPDYTGCCEYYERTLEFDIDTRGWDRTLRDEGTKWLHGHFLNDNSRTFVLDNINGAPPDDENPAHFDAIIDSNGNIIKLALNGAGLPQGAIVEGVTQPAGKIVVSKYPSSNFLALGIPTTL